MEVHLKTVGGESSSSQSPVTGSESKETQHGWCFPTTRGLRQRCEMFTSIEHKGREEMIPPTHPVTCLAQTPILTKKIQ